MSADRKALRRVRHERQSGGFDSNRGREGQIQVKRNAKGDIELVAYFGGKWYYCPMAEFNKTLNLRKGVQIDGRDVMTNTQKDADGFANIRLDATSTNIAPKLNECRIYIDIVPATSAINKNFMLSNGSKRITATSNGANANIVVGLNAIDAGASQLPDGTFITSINSAGDGSNPMKLDLSRAATATDNNQQITFQTKNTSYSNAFLNILYEDGADTYYHKFQLNTTTVSPFSYTDQVTGSGSVGGAGGSGTSSGIL